VVSRSRVRRTRTESGAPGSAYAHQSGHYVRTAFAGYVWRIFGDGEALGEVVASLVAPWQERAITKVCGIEARGFILGGAAACALGVGFAAIRKHGSLFPGEKYQVDAGPDYRGLHHVLEIQRESVHSADNVLLVNDWIERGSQASAACELIERCGGVLAGIAVMIDQLGDDLRAGLPEVTRLVSADDLPPDR
jgi:adenine phosphoribosyltransferase